MATATPTATPAATPTGKSAPDEAAVSPADGGRLAADDGAVEVHVPPSAVTEPVTVRYEPAVAVKHGRVRILRAFHLEATSASGRAVSKFRAPLVITARYAPGELERAGIEPASVGLYYLDEDKNLWVRLPAPDDAALRAAQAASRPARATRAGATELVSGAVDHFSVFAVGGETFETASAGTGNAFSDNFTNTQAWTAASGGGSVASNRLTTTGAANTTDLWVVGNSNSYMDLTYQAQVRDNSKNTSHRVGLVARYANTSNYYSAVLVNDSVRLYKRVANVETLILQVAWTYTAGTPYWLKMELTGTTIKVSTAPDSGGNPGTYTERINRTDSSLTSGQIGVINVNGGGATRTGGFASPGVTITLPQDWSGLTQQTGRPGLNWDRVTAAHGGTGSLQLFSNNSTFVGYAAQTTSNGVTAGTRYQVGGWINTSSVTTGGSNGAKIILVEQPSGTQTTLGTQTGTQGWTQYTTTLTLRSDTTSVDTRVFLQGSGRANFDDIVFTPLFSMTLGSSTANFGGGMDPNGTTSDQSSVGSGYVDGTNGAYYVLNRNAGSYALSITVNSAAVWSGSVSASENSGTSGISIAGGSVRWKLGDMANLTDAKTGTAFSTSADNTVFNTASSCSSGSTKNPGVCTYNYDYSLRALWTDALGTINSVITYSASP